MEKTPIFVFNVGNSKYGMRAEFVLEVREEIQITPLPLSNPAIIGLGNVRGEIIPIVDLGKILYGKESSRASILITSTEKGRVGFAVDSVEKVEYPEEYGITEQKGMVKDLLGKYVEGVVKIGEEFVSVLSIAEVLKDLEG